MMRLSLLIPVLLGYCADETLTGHGAQGQLFVLQSINDEPFAARATISFPAEGEVSGQAPCNGYTTTQTVPYPWFKTGPIAATKRACPDLGAERRYFDALGAMTLSEVSGPHLILSTSEGDKMVFLAE